MGKIIEWAIAHKDTIIAVATLLYSEFKAGNPNTKYQGVIRTVTGTQVDPSALK